MLLFFYVNILYAASRSDLPQLGPGRVSGKKKEKKYKRRLLLNKIMSESSSDQTFYRVFFDFAKRLYIADIGNASSLIW